MKTTLILSSISGSFDGQLRGLITGCRLRAEDEGSLLELHAGVLFELVIQVHNMQDVEELSLVLVQSLDLYVEDRSGIDFDSVVLEDVLGQTDFVLVLDVHELLLRLGVIRIDLQFLHVGQICDPLIADLIGDPLCKVGIAVQQESSLCDAVGLIVELLREHLVEVSELFGHQDRGVKLRNAVDGEAGNDSKVRHADLSVIDDAHLVDLVADIYACIVIAVVDLTLKSAVDLLHDGVDSGKKSGEQLDGPFLKRFRHDGVVCISAALSHNAPRLVPCERVVIHEDAHQLGDGQSGVCIIELEDILLMQLSDVVVCLHVLLDRALKCCGYEEILLFETKLLTLYMVVAGIEDVADRAGKVFLLDGLLVLASVKRVKLEAYYRLRVPDSESIYKAVAITDDRKIIGNGLDRAVAFLLVHGAAVSVQIGGHITTEMHFLGVLGSAKFEGISVLKPV